MPVELGTVKAEEAIANIRSKVGVPTKRWDDWMGSVNAKGFTVAGATKADLIDDFHGSITDAIEQGQSIGEFRKNFDQIVERHGWSYKGNRGWRTRVIYDNNLRSAHMAGRWQQIQRVKKRRPYIIYYTVGDERVRDQHERWHAIALPVDDPWWNTHYPPNGWGCRCYVITANARQLERLGIKVVEAPAIKTSERINSSTGEIYGNVPHGIDTGWDFNVGKSWLGPDAALGEKLVKIPRELRASVSTSLNDKVIDNSFNRWAKNTQAGSTQTVGWLNHNLINALEDASALPLTAAISITQTALRTLVAGSSPLATKDVLRLPALLRNAKAVLRDSSGTLHFVVDIAAKAGQKIVVRADLRGRGELTNNVSSATTESTKVLKNQDNYTLLTGRL